MDWRFILFVLFSFNIQVCEGVSGSEYLQSIAFPTFDPLSLTADDYFRRLDKECVNVVIKKSPDGQITRPLRPCDAGIDPDIIQWFSLKLTEVASSCEVDEWNDILERCKYFVPFDGVKKSLQISMKAKSKECLGIVGKIFKTFYMPPSQFVAATKYAIKVENYEAFELMTRISHFSKRNLADILLMAVAQGQRRYSEWVSSRLVKISAWDVIEYAVSYAAYFGHTDIVMYLYDKLPDSSQLRSLHEALVAAIRGEAVSLVHHILEKDDVDPDYDDGKPLITAIKTENPVLVKELLLYGASGYIADWKPVRAVINIQSIRMLNVLLKSGFEWKPFYSKLKREGKKEDAKWLKNNSMMLRFMNNIQSPYSWMWDQDFRKIRKRPRFKIIEDSSESSLGSGLSFIPGFESIFGNGAPEELNEWISPSNYLPGPSDPPSRPEFEDEENTSVSDKEEIGHDNGEGYFSIDKFDAGPSIEIPEVNYDSDYDRRALENMGEGRRLYRTRSF